MPPRYSPTQIALHWTMAPVIVAAWVLAQVFVDLRPGPEKAWLRGWHILAGLSVLALLLPRLTLRRTAPPLPPGPAWERRAAQAAHLLLYALMLLLPVSGLLGLLGDRPRCSGCSKSPPSPRSAGCTRRRRGCTRSSATCSSACWRCMSPRRYGTCSSGATVRRGG